MDVLLSYPVTKPIIKSLRASIKYCSDSYNDYFQPPYIYDNQSKQANNLRKPTHINNNNKKSSPQSHQLTQFDATQHQTCNNKYTFGEYEHEPLVSLANKTYTLSEYEHEPLVSLSNQHTRRRA